MGAVITSNAEPNAAYMEARMHDPYQQTKVDPNALPPVLRDANIALAVLVLVGPVLAAVLTATGVA